ncbi:alpha/beta hydrolase [Ancylobacter lacus]|uniref:alpha/beta hydrolase n=1 Tax=Ancylobacter lacus TaxID=2579970 RepID=UPI001BCE0261|nr:alpha/beta hydrolase [Ancylobacter lacus]MBS7539200.1 alpha/beta hydrolase [Ancylobacter lacus]
MPVGADVTRLETEQGTLKLRLHRPAAPGRAVPLVFHLHGGAFTGGSCECGACIAGLLAEAGAVVLSVDYPLAPAHPFPAALNLCFAGLGTLHRERAAWGRRASPIFVAGEEAGANIAAALAMMARDQGGPPLAGQILISPMLDPNLATCSIRQAEAGPVGCKWADGWHRYLGTADKAAHPYAAPLGARRLGGLAPALVLTAEDDPMRDESRAYAARLRECGGTVCERVLPAPTRWPDALGETACAPSDWIGSLRTIFSTFLASPSASGGLERPSDVVGALTGRGDIDA